MVSHPLPTTITLSQPREAVRVTFKNGTVLEGTVGTPIEAFLATNMTQNGSDPSLLMGGILDGRLRELAYPVMRDGTLDQVLLSSSDGGRIYRRSLVMLMTTAAIELFPGVKVSVRYSIPEGGFYCKLLNHKPFTQKELETLDAHMRLIVNANELI